MQTPGSPGEHIFQGDVPVLFDDPFIRESSSSKGRAEIGIAELIEERVQGVLCPAGDVWLVVQDLVHAVGNVLLVRPDVGEQILDGPFPGTPFSVMRRVKPTRLSSSSNLSRS
jgi:hypothetical protein